MKKTKLLMFSALALLTGATLVSCKPGNEENNKDNSNSNLAVFDKDGKYVNTTWQKVKDGFTNIQADLNDPDVNKPVQIKDGKRIYTVAGQDIELKDTLNTIYLTEMSNKKFDYIVSSEANNTDMFASMIDGLFDNTRSKRLVGSLAIGEKLEHVDGKPVYTFQLRKNVPWVVNKTGEIYEVDGKKQYVNADDFVEAAFYALTNPNTKADFVYTLFVKGADEFRKYVSTVKNSDPDKAKKLRDKFNELVGVKANADKDEISYELTYDVPFFKSVTTYSPYLPVNRHYLEEQASNFGQSEDNILVNGAYRMTENTEQSKKVLEENKLYWDRQHVYLSKVNFSYLKGGLAPDAVRLMFENGQLDSFNVSKVDKEGWNKYVGDGNSLLSPKSDLATPISVIGQASYYFMFNFYRTNYEYNDKNDAPDAETKKSTRIAVQNTDFRLAFLYGLDFVDTRKTSTENPQNQIYRRITTPDLAINNENRKDYVSYVDEAYNKQLKTSGVILTGKETGFDPIQNNEIAKEYFKKAAEALKTNSEVQLPIRIDVKGSQDLINKQQERNRYQILEKLAKEANGGQDLIKFYINYPQNDVQDDNWIATQNMDIISTGWGPDYADPYTYLHTITINGDLAEYYGLSFNNEVDVNDQSEDTKADREKKAIANQIFGEYANELEEANNEISNVDLRYKKFAKAEIDAIYKYGLILPYYTSTTTVVSVSKIVPFQSAKVAYGINTSRYKNVVVATEILPRDIKTTIIKDFHELQGNNVDENTITLLNPENDLPFESNFKGSTQNLIVNEGSKYHLPSLYDVDSRKVVRKWYTDKSLSTPVELTNGLATANGNATLYGKVDDLNVVETLELSGTSNSLAKEGNVTDYSYEYPIFKTNDSASINYTFDLNATYANSDKVLEDKLVVSVLPADENNEKDQQLANVLSATIDPINNQLVVILPNTVDDAALQNAKVRVVVKGSMHKDGDNANSMKALTFVVASVKTNYSTVFSTDTNVNVITTQGTVNTQLSLENNNIGTLNGNTITLNGKTGTILVNAHYALTDSSVNIDLNQQLAISVTDRVTVGDTVDFATEGTNNLTVTVEEASDAEVNGTNVAFNVANKQVKVIVKNGENVVREVTVKVEADKAYIKRVLNYVIGHTKNNTYTAETKANLDNAIKEAKKAIEDYETSEENVEQVTKNLKVAYFALVEAE